MLTQIVLQHIWFT